KIAEKVLRKSAHFILYMIFGIFSGLSLYGICGAKNRKRPVVVIWLSAVLIVILYAASDEIHQIFVDGRSCEVRDILTDTAGGAAGAGMAILIGRFGKKKNKNTKKTQKIF
ncbi:MAG: VanZ family protein, partial [Oscillospiraceae bacterium]|nr:VanZ family protein [Oscillospiraceae bacterium]